MSGNDGTHSGQPAESRAACESHQKSFSLIVHRVACTDSVAAILTRRVEQESISDLSRRFFQPAMQGLSFPFHIDCAYAGIEPRSLSQRADELGVFGRFSPAQFVIEVREVKP